MIILNFKKVIEFVINFVYIIYLDLRVIEIVNIWYLFVEEFYDVYEKNIKFIF